MPRHRHIAVQVSHGITADTPISRNRETVVTDTTTAAEHHASCLLTGALAHLTEHMENGCRRSARQAIILFNQIAEDSGVDAQLREHAERLIEILERPPRLATSPVMSVRNGQSASFGPRTVL